MPFIEQSPRPLPNPENRYNKVKNDIRTIHPIISGRTTAIVLISQLGPKLGQLFRPTPFLRTSSGDEPLGSLYGEKYLKRLLWYLLGGTRGGPNRAEIIKSLQNRPCNANQLAEVLGVDYKTIQHHVKILIENGLIAPSEKGTYGAVLFLTSKMEEALPILDEIWGKIGRRKISTSEQEAR
jgi:DNA-binding transcriptional ArsR family regulator